ncbi:MAG: transcription antitermination factor NusB [Calditrichaeota bacterium]|nr:transcription antitermination factor NusB [Calditrichota bacterium]
MSRRKEREIVLKVLFAQEYNPIPYTQQLDFILSEDDDIEAVTPFVKKMIEKCLELHEELDERIKTKLINWDFNRVATMDRILLRMALVEFMCFEDIPPEVTIDEMIEIGKKYSTSNSGKFINGILDALLKELKAEKKIKKSGRGLITKVRLND